jgi:phosphatidylglycerol:prolipoprotein diacylglycerol transferase
MLPKLFQYGSFFLPTYGVLVAAAFLIALWMTSRLARAARMNPEAVVNLGVYSALAGIVGAKLLMIVMDPLLRSNPAAIFSLATLQSAGIFYGGLIAGLLMAYFYMVRNGLPLLETPDIFAPGLSLGHGIGRLGCFAAGCCWGRQTGLPWAVIFTNPDARAVGVPIGVRLHPTQLYESFGEFLICAILLLAGRRKHRPGSIIGGYLALYGTLRFVVEFFRVHDDSNPLGLALSLEQWISLGLGVAGLALIFLPRTQPLGSVSKRESHA